jgi:hypothetical protein
MSFPTLFDWLERFAFLRGYPAAYLVLLTAVVVIMAWDWRPALLGLAGQYLFAGLLFVDVLDPRLAIIKVLVGLFVCLILYMTARQVNWGRLPVDVTSEEVARLEQERRIRIGPYLLPTTMPFRIFLTLMMILVVVTLAQRPEYQLPFVPESLRHITLAVYALGGLGLLGLGLTWEPLKAGMAVLMFLSGFELFYSALEQSVIMLASLAAVNLVVVLAIAYLVQARHAVMALFD